MAKKIRFPLEMKDSVQVRTLSELKEHWDIDKVEGYFLDGKLETWLRDRYCEAEAEKVSELDGNDKNRRQKLCEIFGMEYEADEGELADAEALRDKQARLDKLRQYTNDKNILDHINHVAFDTEEILDAIDAGAETIYLVNNEFEIPLQVKNKQYVGVGKAIAKIASEKAVDFEALGIRFENVNFNEDYVRIGNGLGNDDENTSVNQSNVDSSTNDSCTVFKAYLKMMDDEDEEEEDDEVEDNLDDGRILTLAFKKEKLKGIVLSEDDNSLYLFKLNAQIALDTGDKFALFDEEDEIASGVIIDVYEETTLEKAGIYKYIRVRSDKTGIRDYVKIKGLGCPVIILWRNREIEGTILLMETDPGLFYPSFEYVIELHGVVAIEEFSGIRIRPEDSPREFEWCQVRELISKDEMQKRMDADEDDDNEEDDDK